MRRCEALAADQVTVVGAASSRPRLTLSPEGSRLRRLRKGQKRRCRLGLQYVISPLDLSLCTSGSIRADMITTT